MDHLNGWYMDVSLRPFKGGNDRYARPRRRSCSSPIRFTHSIPTAVFLADRVLAMSERPGAIAAIYDVPPARPRSLDVMADPVFAERAQTIRRHFSTQRMDEARS